MGQRSGQGWEDERWGWPDAYSDTELIYRYVYNGRDEVTEKEVPGSEVMNYRYDDRGIQTYSQDGNQRLTNRWLHDQYDEYGRLTKSGFIESASLPDGNQTMSIDADDLLVENTYDQITDPAHPIERGKLTLSKAKVLNTTNTFIERTYRYDEFGRLEETVNNTILDASMEYGYVTYRVANSYDFADNLLSAAYSYEKTDQSSFDVTYEYEYDHSSRQVVTKLVAPTISANPIKLTETAYTPKDQIKTLEVGFGGNSSPLQTVDYEYRTNGFLQSINDYENLGTDLFALTLHYDTQIIGGASPQKNGNISEAIWKTAGSNTTASYNFEYDYLSRLLECKYGEIVGTGFNLTEHYSTTYQYEDKRGNLKSVTRQGTYGENGSLSFTQIDDLTYTYLPGTNQLTQVNDAVNAQGTPLNVNITNPITTNQTIEAIEGINASSVVGSNNTVTFTAGREIKLGAGFEAQIPNGGSFTAEVDEALLQNPENQGFVERSTTAYTYDPNGNLTSNLDNEIISIRYNYLNLPYEFLLTEDRKKEIIYTADGEKLSMNYSVRTNGTWITEYTHFYLNSLEIRNDDIEAIYHDAGRIIKDAEPLSSSSFKYQYNLTDHLGNVRVIFETADHSSPVSSGDVVHEYHYYPFGMEQKGDWQRNTSVPGQRYRYNGKEFSEKLGLYDYGARWYDPAIARWNAVDPLADEYTPFSPYNYVLGNPIRLVDPDGRTVKPAASLKGEKRKIFNSLRKNNTTYNNLLARYDTKSTSSDLHFVVGSAGKLSASDAAYAHTRPVGETETQYSPSRRFEALRKGTVNSDFVAPNVEGMSSIGIAATLIHEGVHGFILAEGPFAIVGFSDHHVPKDDLLFDSTVEGLTEYVNDNGLEFSEEDIKLLAAQGLWGTTAVNQAFGLDPNSENYDQQIRELQAKSRSLFFDED